MAECVFLSRRPSGGTNLNVLPMHNIKVRNLNAACLASDIT